MTRFLSWRADNAAFILPIPSSTGIRVGQHRHRADRAGKDADLEAEILGDPRRDRVIDGASVHAAIAGHQSAEALASFGPIHRISSPSQVFEMVSRALSLSWDHAGQRELIMDKRI